MACGSCGGRKKATPRSAGVADGSVDPRPHRWLVRFPNGTEQQFDSEWQANAARSVANGDPPRKVYTDGGNPNSKRAGVPQGR